MIVNEARIWFCICKSALFVQLVCLFCKATNKKRCLVFRLFFFLPAIQVLCSGPDYGISVSWATEGIVNCEEMESISIVWHLRDQKPTNYQLTVRINLLLIGNNVGMKWPSYCMRMALSCLHRGIGRPKAEQLLLDAGKDGSYLVRESETVPGGFTLCLLWVASCSMTLFTSDNLPWVLIEIIQKESGKCSLNFHTAIFYENCNT